MGCLGLEAPAPLLRPPLPPWSGSSEQVDFEKARSLMRSPGSPSGGGPAPHPCPSCWMTLTVQTLASRSPTFPEGDGCGWTCPLVFPPDHGHRLCSLPAWARALVTWALRLVFSAVGNSGGCVLWPHPEPGGRKLFFATSGGPTQPKDPPASSQPSWPCLSGSWGALVPRIPAAAPPHPPEEAGHFHTWETCRIQV